jgi:hypothetical protein
MNTLVGNDDDLFRRTSSSFLLVAQAAVTAVAAILEDEDEAAKKKKMINEQEEEEHQRQKRMRTAGRKPRQRSRRSMAEIYESLGPYYFRRAYRMSYESFNRLHGRMKEGIEAAAAATATTRRRRPTTNRNRGTPSPVPKQCPPNCHQCQTRMRFAIFPRRVAIRSHDRLLWDLSHRGPIWCCSILLVEESFARTTAATMTRREAMLSPPSASQPLPRTH